MVRLKRDTSGAATSGFSIYDGPDPSPGAYRGILKRVTVRTSANNNPYYNCLVELADNVDGKAQFDGYPAWVMITMVDNEFNLAREQAFYRAIGVGDTPALDYDEESEELKKIGTKTTRQILGTPVIVNLRNNGDRGLQGEGIYPRKDTAIVSSKAEVDEEDEELLEEETEEMSEEEAERREELEALTIAKLRRAAKDSEADITGLTAKGDIIEAIIDVEFGAEDEDEDAADEEEEELADYETYNSIRSLVKLRAKVLEDFGDTYDKDDLVDLKKADLLQMLVDDELVADPNPPF